MIYVIDLFCGMGGFSQGASQAGCQVILAIDSWQEALDVHRLNHPRCHHLCMELGCDKKVFISLLSNFMKTVPMARGDKLHIHASPPCQTLTKTNMYVKDQQHGMKLVNWSLDILKNFKPHSWTLEQVPHKLVLSELKRRELCCVIIKANEYGVSQTRRRVVAGNIDFEKLTQFKENSEPLSLIMQRLDIIPEEGFDHIRNCGRPLSERKPNGLSSHQDYSKVSYTVTHCFPQFYNISTRKGKVLPLKLFKALQTFPESYLTTTKARQMIGNAVPCLLAEKIMYCV